MNYIAVNIETVIAIVCKVKSVTPHWRHIAEQLRTKVMYILLLRDKMKSRQIPIFFDKT